MRVLMRVRMIMRMRVFVLVRVFVALLVRMSTIRERILLLENLTWHILLATDNYIYLCCRDAPAHHARNLQRCAYIQSGDGLLQ